MAEAQDSMSYQLRGLICVNSVKTHCQTSYLAIPRIKVEEYTILMDMGKESEWFLKLIQSSIVYKTFDHIQMLRSKILL